MATSTEATVRSAIVTALQAIALTDLGFDNPGGNIRPYLLDYEASEKKASYLSAQVAGKNTVYAIAVDVTGSDEWYAMGNITKRTYKIIVRIYRAVGVNGDGSTAVIEAARKIRGAIRGMTSTLSSTVDIASGTGELERDFVDGVDGAHGEMVVGTLTYEAQKVNPTF